MSTEETKKMLEANCINYAKDEDECDYMCEVLSNAKTQYYLCCYNCEKLQTCQKACVKAKALKKGDRFDAKE